MIGLPDPHLIVLTIALGGLLTLDSTTFGQFMLSRPIFAATVAGAIMGSPEHGMFVGVVMEALHLTVLPFGASRYPESAAPAVMGGAAYAHAAGGAGMLLVTILMVLAWEWVAGETVRPMRHLNSRLRPDPGAERFSAGMVFRRHTLALGIDFVRGVLLTAIGFALAILALEGVQTMLRPHEWTAWVSIGAASTAALAATIRMFGVERLPLFLAGAAVGALALIVL